MVKKIISKCVVCKRYMGKAYDNPTVASLPDFRVKEAPAFSKVGVDFAGPLYAKEGGSMVKVYIALFTCCVTRAIYLDLVRSLSASSFMNCLRRFAARNGVPRLIISDNAKTFKATERALSRLYSSREVRAYLENNKLEWLFNLERAPWWGGFFERMVGSVKRCLRKVLGNAKLTFDELLTTLVEIEGTLNSRPLTYAYDETEVEVLTPSHLIFGRRLSSIPDDVVCDGDDDDDYKVGVTRRFRNLARKRVHFWNRWRREYLTDLREHHKQGNKTGTRRVSIGDVVLVYEENVKRGEWKLGKVERLIVGKDQEVRGARVKVSTRDTGKPVYLNRPVQKLYPLEVRSSEDKEERNVERADNNRELQEEVKDTADVVKEALEDRAEGDLARRPRRAAALDARWKNRVMLEP